MLIRAVKERNSLFFARIATLAALINVGTALAASNEPPNATPQDVFDAMRGSFQPAKAKGVHARYQWDLSGPNGGKWWIEVNNGTYKMGLSYWPTKDSRRSGSSQKARRNVSLKFRFRCDSEIRRRISPLRLIDPEEIEIALNCSACAGNDLKRFKTRIPDLQTGAILTVLNEGVV
jgi:hypothetical protein